MKNFFKFLSILFLMITFVACSDEPPSFRVRNEMTNKANVQIKTVTNTENINDVQPGTTTNYKEVAEGKVDISAEIQNETNEPTNTFNAEKNNNYTVVIVNTTPPTIRIDVTDK
ncbi:MAG TPA: DUF4397 domain-containing protein [Ignavibacteriaceae bacterium]|nr:DUF4397 domain-containing protein [Ignavibacteriaceae bacterium]